ncbi:hypothetical protein YYC_04868, partial [Plasmodium yoelii 17X]
YKGNEPFGDKPLGNGGNKNKYSLLTNQVKNGAHEKYNESKGCLDQKVRKSNKKKLK